MNTNGRIVCTKHNRWIIQGNAKRACPECPKPTHPVHVYGLLVDRVGWRYSDGSTR